MPMKNPLPAVATRCFFLNNQWSQVPAEEAWQSNSGLAARALYQWCHVVTKLSQVELINRSNYKPDIHAKDRKSIYIEKVDEFKMALI